MAKKNGIQTPPGYFDSLQSRLASMADTAASAHKVSVARRVAPYFAYAASLVAAVLIGSFILRETAVPDSETVAWQENLLAELQLTTDPDAFVFQPEEIVNP